MKSDNRKKKINSLHSSTKNHNLLLYLPNRFSTQLWLSGRSIWRGRSL